MNIQQNMQSILTKSIICSTVPLTTAEKPQKTFMADSPNPNFLNQAREQQSSRTVSASVIWDAARKISLNRSATEAAGTGARSISNIHDNTLARIDSQT